MYYAFVLKKPFTVHPSGRKIIIIDLILMNSHHRGRLSSLKVDMRSCEDATQTSPNLAALGYSTFVILDVTFL